MVEIIEVRPEDRVIIQGDYAIDVAAEASQEARDYGQTAIFFVDGDVEITILRQVGIDNLPENPPPRDRER